MENKNTKSVTRMGSPAENPFKPMQTIRLKADPGLTGSVLKMIGSKKVSIIWNGQGKRTTTHSVEEIEDLPQTIDQATRDLITKAVQNRLEEA